MLTRKEVLDIMSKELEDKYQTLIDQREVAKKRLAEDLQAAQAQFDKTVSDAQLKAKVAEDFLSQELYDMDIRIDQQAEAYRRLIADNVVDEIPGAPVPTHRIFNRTRPILLCVMFEQQDRIFTTAELINAAINSRHEKNNEVASSITAEVSTLFRAGLVEKPDGDGSFRISLMGIKEMADAKGDANQVNEKYRSEFKRLKEEAEGKNGAKKEDKLRKEPYLPFEKPKNISPLIQNIPVEFAGT